MIKTEWIYEYRNKEARTSLEGDRILVDGMFGKREQTIEVFLSCQFLQAPLAIETEICQYIVQEFECNKAWEETTKWRYQFWKAIDLDALEILIIDNKTLHLDAQYHFTRVGEYTMQELGGGSETEMNAQRLDHLFFWGTRSLKLDLKTRTNIKKQLWSALDDASITFTYQDGFPLFDYDLIERKKWEKVIGRSGEYLEILPNKGVEIGGWDNPRSGGSQMHSIETIWAHTAAYIPATLRQYLPEVKKYLKKGILPS
jgi:hypothetical protein